MLLKICCLKVSVPDNRIKCFDDLKHVGKCFSQTWYNILRFWFEKEKL